MSLFYYLLNGYTVVLSTLNGRKATFSAVTVSFLHWAVFSTEIRNLKSAEFSVWIRVSRFLISFLQEHMCSQTFPLCTFFMSDSLSYEQELRCVLSLLWHAHQQKKGSNVFRQCTFKICEWCFQNKSEVEEKSHYSSAACICKVTGFFHVLLFGFIQCVFGCVPVICEAASEETQ